MCALCLGIVDMTGQVYLTCYSLWYLHGFSLHVQFIEDKEQQEKYPQDRAH